MKIVAKKTQENQTRPSQPRKTRKTRIGAAKTIVCKLPFHPDATYLVMLRYLLFPDFLFSPHRLILFFTTHGLAVDATYRSTTWLPSILTFAAGSRDSQPSRVPMVAVSDTRVFLPQTPTRLPGP
jgi:hypothetical protein